MIHGVFFKHPQSETYHEAINQLASHLTFDPKRNEMNTLWFSDGWFAYEKAVCLARLSEELVVLAWGRIDNQAELRQKLSLSFAETQTWTTPEWIARVYLDYQENCTAHLIGDFSFVIYDGRTSRLFLARDQMGIKPLYYYQDASIFAFSTSLSLFHNLPHVSIKPRLEWASQFLITQSLAMDFETTAYHQVFKCPPAHHIVVTRQQMQKKRYFEFHTEKIHFKHADEYLEYYRSHLNEAVKQRVQVDHPLGAELSGGIDSSSVVALALEYYSRPISDFHSFAFAYFENEPKHILSMSQYFRMPMTYVCCNISEFPHDNNRVLKILGAPCQHGNAVSHEIFYAKAEALGVQTLLSGFGGDEFVTSLHGGFYLFELLKQKQYKLLYQNMIGSGLMQLLRFIKFTYLHRAQSGVRSQQMSNAYAKRWPNVILKPSMIENYALKMKFENQAQFDQGYQNLDQFTLEKRLAPFISTRTEEGSLMSSYYGLEYRWPLLDVRLIQCFLSIPTSEKYHKGQGRYLHRRAIANKVPANIIAQNSKYMGERMAQSIPKQRTLNQDLHPAIFDIVDQDKMWSQEKKLAEQVAINASNLHQESMLTIRSNMDKINALDHWFKYFYPKHYDWAT